MVIHILADKSKCVEIETVDELRGVKWPFFGFWVHKSEPMKSESMNRYTIDCFWPSDGSYGSKEEVKRDWENKSRSILGNKSRSSILLVRLEDFQIEQEFNEWGEVCP